MIYFKKILSIGFHILFITIPSLIFVFLLLEFIVFRFIYLPSDYPKSMFDPENKIIKYIPLQQGTFRRANEIAARFTINSDGFNSSKNKYNTTKHPDTFKIAVIGDSCILSVQVNVEDNVCERLESRLRENRLNAEVYNFGVSGVPLSHYLHMMRYVVKHYSPDLIVVNIVHNDFLESLVDYPAGHRYSESLMKLKIKANNEIEEIRPLPYSQPVWEKILVSTAMFRALWQRAGLAVKLHFVKDYIFNFISKRETRYEANIDTNKVNDQQESVKIVTQYVLKKMAELCRENDVALLLVMNAVTQIIYREAKDESVAYKINKIVIETARKNNLSVVDLQKPFSVHYRKNRNMFEFNTDGHWNKIAHDIVAEEICEYIKQIVKPTKWVNG